MGHPAFLAGARKAMLPFSAACLALDFSRPALKRMITVEHTPATLKRCFPPLKQRAPT
jgi:hypothetical protein